MTSSLITKLEEAGEGSRELDGDIERVLFPEALIMTDGGSVGPKARPAVRQPLSSVPQLRGDVIAECTGVPFYTTSLDAALALAERVLPGWSYGINGEIGGGATVTLEQPDVDLGDGVIASPGLMGLEDFEADGATPALALCIATLQAKSKESGE